MVKKKKNFSRTLPSAKKWVYPYPTPKQSHCTITIEEHLSVVEGVPSFEIWPCCPWNFHVGGKTKKEYTRDVIFVSRSWSAFASPPMCFTFYIACVRSVLLYACPIFHFSMPVYLSTNLKRVLLSSLNYFGGDIISIYVFFSFIVSFIILVWSCNSVLLQKECIKESI